jgi:geranylgeranyl pyrophosphate synthase
MNLPASAKIAAPQIASAPSRLRARLLHQLRLELDPHSLRRQGAGEEVTLPRQYWQKALGTPLRDFLGRGSKMFRAHMAEWAWAAAGGEGELCIAIPLAVESLHAGSLIIDDIEDNAGFRRGDVALHERYGTATALNAGNWLYFWPVRLLSEAGLTPEQELGALKKLGETQHRSHLGQGLDVSLKVHDIHQEDMAGIVQSKTTLKTGALMGLSAYLGALGAGASPEAREAFARFGERLGGVLQMLDDAGSITSEDRSEKAREDLIQGTPTWPWVWAAQSLDGPTYRELVDLSHEVQAGRVDFSFLRQRLRLLLPSELPSMLRSDLEAALDELRPVIAHPTCIEIMYREFTRLEQSYA